MAWSCEHLLFWLSWPRNLADFSFVPLDDGTSEFRYPYLSLERFVLSPLLVFVSSNMLPFLPAATLLCQYMDRRRSLWYLPAVDCRSLGSHHGSLRTSSPLSGMVSLRSTRHYALLCHYQTLGTNSLMFVCRPLGCFMIGVLSPLCKPLWLAVLDTYLLRQFFGLAALPAF
ncbi:hypothetical protein V6N13_007830 [Hibiscus sabdariffa]|uniref:Uncharacterized protein n=1 Tax=Hibiscus sabdariffa TaxID=183260 RepID=A0ABR2PCF7_9ROSI